MRFFIIFIVFITTSQIIFAQSPGFNYQAVLRDAEGQVMPTTDITLFFTLKDGSDGNILYRESQHISSNEIGLINTMIGTGTVETGNYEDIVGIVDLALQVELQIAGETDIIDFGDNGVGGMPYALYGKDEDADPENEMQQLLLENDSLKLSGSPSINLKQYQSPWLFDPDSNSYFLALEDTPNQRDGEKNGIQYKLKNGMIIKSEFINDQEEAVFKIKDAKSVDDLPENMQQTYMGIKTYLMNEFMINIDESKAEIDAEFKVRNGRIIKYNFEIKTNDDKMSVIEVYKYPSFLVDIVEVYFDNSEREIFLNGKTDYFDANKFGLFYGSQNILGFKEFFIEQNGKRKKVDPKLFNEQSYFEGTQDETPAFALESDESTGSTSLSLFSTKENDDCFHVLASPNGVSNTIYGNQTSVIGQFYADDVSGFNLSGNDGCSSHGTCNSFILVNSDNTRSAPFSSALMSSNGDKSGALVLSNQQSRNVQLTSLTDFPNNGYILVLDDQDQNKAGIFVDNTGAGVVYGSNINSIVQGEDGQKQAIVYGALVGGESAAYDRGTATLVNGEATIYCPDHFQNIADPNSMTVTITPLSADSKGIAVVEKFPGGFKVKELGDGKGNYGIDYMVSCKRKGQEDFQVKRSLATPNQIQEKKFKTGGVTEYSKSPN